MTEWEVDLRKVRTISGTSKQPVKSVRVDAKKRSQEVFQKRKSPDTILKAMKGDETDFIKNTPMDKWEVEAMKKAAQAPETSGLSKRPAYNMPVQEKRSVVTTEKIKAPKPENMARMSRSDLIQVDDVAYWSRSAPAQIPSTGREKRHIISESDRIDSIAKKYYQNEKLWWIIAEANGLRILPDDLKVGSKLIIPDMSAVRLNIDKRSGSVLTKKAPPLIPNMVKKSAVGAKKQPVAVILTR